MYGSISGRTVEESEEGYIQNPTPKLKTRWVDPDLPDLPEESNSSGHTALQLMNSMIGSGILTFPKVLSQVGIVYMGVMLILFCTITALSSLMVIAVGQEVKVMDYALATEKVFGKRTGQSLQLAAALGFLGALCTYVNVIGSLGSMVVQMVAPWLPVIRTYPGFIVVSAFPLLPMVFKRAYGELTYISACSVLFIVAAVGFVFVEGPGEVGRHAIPAWPISALLCLKTLGNFGYATSCQALVVEAYLSTRREAKSAFWTSMWAAVAGGGALLIAMAVAGYSSFGDDVASNVMMSFRSGWVSAIGCSLVVTHIIFYIPNDFVIMRLYVFQLARTNILQVPAVPYVATTLALLAIPMIFMATVPAEQVGGVFNLVLTLTGDIPIGYVGYMLPGLLYLQTFGLEKGGGMVFGAVLIIVVGICCMVICPAIDITEFVAACRSEKGCNAY